jgi:hypothetical protein
MKKLIKLVAYLVSLVIEKILFLVMVFLILAFLIIILPVLVFGVTYFLIYMKIDRFKEFCAN